MRLRCRSNSMLYGLGTLSRTSGLAILLKPLTDYYDCADKKFQFFFDLLTGSAAFAFPITKIGRLEDTYLLKL